MTLNSFNYSDLIIAGIVPCVLMALIIIMLGKVLARIKRTENLKGKKEEKGTTGNAFKAPEPTIGNVFKEPGKKQGDIPGKQMEQNEGQKTLPDKKQEAETIMTLIESMENKKQSFDYRKIFLTAPKLEDRKPVFISRTTRDSLDTIARRLGDRKMSVSGFLENMAKHHLEEYKDGINRLNKE